MREIRYDVFISAKSQDYPHAAVAAKYLADAGLRVFFSKVELGQLGDSDYYAAIDRALEASRHMLVVTSSYDNADSPWVRKEWQTFINEKLSKRKSGNLLSLLYNGMIIDDLPQSLRQYEVRFSNDLPSLISYFKPPDSEKKAPARPAWAANVTGPAKLPHSVYISYSTNDKAVAEAICRALEHHSIPCWIAPRDLVPGAVYEAAVGDAIRSARVVIVIVSTHADASDRVKNEVASTTGAGVRLLPVRIEKMPRRSALKSYIGQNPLFDATTPPFQRHLDELIPVVRDYIKNPAPRSDSWQNSPAPRTLPPLPLVPPPLPSEKALLKSPGFIALLVFIGFVIFMGLVHCAGR